MLNVSEGNCSYKMRYKKWRKKSRELNTELHNYQKQEKNYTKSVLSLSKWGISTHIVNGWCEPIWRLSCLFPYPLPAPNNYTCCLESEKLWNGLWLASFSPRGFTDDLFSLFHIKTPKEGMLKSIDFPHTHTYSVHPYLNILIL